MNKREILAIDAAKLYYLEGWSQARIAKAFGVSRPTVSKLLSLSRTEGFARIEIKDPRKMGEALSRELELRYGLKEAMVVWENGGNVLESVCKTAAEVLSELVKDGDSIGITGGRTIGSVGKNLAILDRVGVKVIQLKGGISLSNSGESDWETVNFYRTAFNAEAIVLPLPAVFKSAQVKRLVLEEPFISSICEQGANVDIGVFTVGAARKGSNLFGSGNYTEDEQEKILRESVGHICSHWVDREGKICCPEIDERTVGVPLDAVRTFPVRLLVATGLAKVEILETALSCGMATHLVVDQVTAQAVLNLT